MLEPHKPAYLKKMITAGVLTIPIVILCVLYVDVPLALYVQKSLYSNVKWSRMTTKLPDLLLMVVLLSMFGAWVLYFVRARKKVFDSTTMLARHIMWLAPASYLSKTLLKMAFGRVETRLWLQDPGLYGFHFFQLREGCDGFPSGHMMVIVALMAGVCRFYPAARPLAWLTGILLAVALIATNYHFLGDVIAGAYCGILLEILLFQRVTGRPLDRLSGNS